MGKKKVEEVKNNKKDSKETGKDSDNKKEIKNLKEKDTSKVKNKSSENKKRTKTDDYYYELTKENKIVDIIKEKEEKIKEEKTKEEKIKEEQKPQDNKSVTKKNVTKSDMIFLNIQFFLSIITIVLVIVYFFNKSLMFALQISLGLTMIVTGVNNIKVYKRKALTVFYFILGIALLVLAVITMLGK